MPDPTLPLRGIPQFEFDDDAVFFDPSGCNHGSTREDERDSAFAELIVNGEDEDHLLPPYAIHPETFSKDLLEAERTVERIPEVELAANPEYEGPSYGAILKRSLSIHADLQDQLIHLRSDPKAYMRLVRKIINEIYYVPVASVIPTNHKMAKGLKHGWRTEGVVLAPNVVAGLGDVCPFRSPLCTVNCLNLSGHAEIAGGVASDIVDCRRRRTLMFMHVRDAFMARVAGLIDKRSSENPGRYAVRLNVMSDLEWEKIEFYDPWSGRFTTLVELFENVVFYDYTKNCQRYQDWLTGKLPRNYYLTFSMSEINALYALYALVQGGAVTVIFDAMPEHIGGDKHVRYPADPLPKSFCGFPVIDGDQTDLRFEDRARFGIPDGHGFVVGLRLKGKAHRREYNRDKFAAAGFIFDAKRAYGSDYAEELVYESERRRMLVKEARGKRDLPGSGKQGFAGIQDKLVSEAKRVLGL